MQWVNRVSCYNCRLLNNMLAIKHKTPAELIVANDVSNFLLFSTVCLFNRVADASKFSWTRLPIQLMRMIRRYVAV